MLALEAFGLLKSKRPDLKDLRLVLAGIYRQCTFLSTIKILARRL